MRIKRIERGYTAFMSDHEYSMMVRILSHFNIDKEWLNMTVGERRSWSRRIRNGSYFRTDQDHRTHKY